MFASQNNRFSHTIQLCQRFQHPLFRYARKAEMCFTGRFIIQKKISAVNSSATTTPVAFIKLHVGQNCHKNKKSLQSKSSQGFFHTVY